MEMTVGERQALVGMYAIIDTLLDSPEGAPAGILYMGVMNRMSHFQFETLLGMLVAKGLVTRQAHLLKWVGEDPRKKSAN